MSIQEQYDGFLQAGGKILVCPGCAADAGITADDLRDGAIMGAPDSVAATLLRADKILYY